MQIYLPYIISFFIGFFLLNILLKKKSKPSLSLHIFLAAGVGLGISSTIAFFSFVFFNGLNKTFIQHANHGLLALFFLLNVRRWIKYRFKDRRSIISDIQHVLAIGVIIAVSLPLWEHAHFYLFGGWDAWSTWNFKAKMLLLSEDWKKIFDPILWRSSPHYPLLLPLTNVWGWIYQPQLTQQTTVLTSYFFTISSFGLLFAALQEYTKKFIYVICSIVLLTSPFIIKLSLSQYCDHVHGYYILGTVVCLIFAKTKSSRSYAFLAGLLAGLASFTKSEGLISSLILMTLSSPFILWKNPSEQKYKVVAHFILGALLGYIPAMIFYAFYAPENLTMINGLTSSEKPSTFFRLKMIVSFYLVEIVSPKWEGLLIAFLAGLLLSVKRCFRPSYIIIPIFLASYWSVITAFYFINTYFKIDWWLQVSLDRIIFALVPTIFLWVMLSLGQVKTVEGK